jgi:hypothetical protein
MSLTDVSNEETKEIELVGLIFRVNVWRSTSQRHIQTALFRIQSGIDGTDEPRDF